MLILPAAIALGDSVTLKNGDHISGKIIKTDGGSVVVKTDYAGEVKIELKSVASLTSDNPLFVAQKNGPTSHGKVAVTNDTLKVENGPDVKVADVSAIRDDATEKNWEREDERLHHPHFLDFWVGSVTFGLAEASGNSSTTTVSTTGAAARVAGKYKLAVHFGQVYSRQSTTMPFGVTADRVGGGVRLDRDFSDKVFSFGTADFDYDQFLGLNLRSVFGGGLGWHAWKSSRGSLNLGAGGDYDRENFTGAVNRNSAELLGTEELNVRLISKLKLIQHMQVFPNMSNLGQFRLAADANASMPIFKALEWNIGATDQYESNPLPGRKTNDVLLTTGVRFSFDQTKR
jgi:putative salt-induced outer membrane protein YdiY